MSRIVPVFVLAASVAVPVLLRGDTFVLRDGGRIEGDWLNPDDSPRKVYEIQLESGGTLVVDANRVKQVIPRSPQKSKYLQWLKKMPASADGHWKMAQWCARQRLPDERLFHLQSVIAFEPNHPDARLALGYRQVDSEWVLTDDLMTERGFVKYKGRWRLPQDVALMEQADKDREQAGEWTRKIRLWQRWLGTRREGEALEQLLRLSDPSTTPIVIDMLASEENPALRKLWIQVLGNLATPPAATALLGNSLADPRRDVRRASLEQLERLRPPQATAFYTAALRRSDVAMVRRAALALQRLGNESAVRPLIDALVTEHKVVIPPGNPNEINTIFGSGSASSGTGFSTGSRATVEKRRFANREALDALIQITGQNFQYDQDAWRRWYTERDAPLATINLRRDP